MGCARAGLDDVVEAGGGELADRFGHERDPALSRRRLLRNSDPHRRNSTSVDS
jgi:hypothetical protein